MKALAALVLLLLPACGGEASRDAGEGGPAAAAPAGDPQRGRALIAQYGCPACHAVPGIDGPQGSLGPSLAGMASRATIGGRIPNGRDAMTAYLQNPPAVDPETRMPPLGVSADEAQHMTAYLFTLR